MKLYAKIRGDATLGFTLAVLVVVTIFCPLIFFGCFGKSKSIGKPNILLITIEGMRGDLVGPRAAKPMEMPVIDKLYMQGTVFKRTIVTSPSRTASYASLLTGMYPPSLGVRENRVDTLPDSAITVFEVLNKNGWNTGAIISNLDAASQWGLNQGFDYFNDTLISPSEDEALPRRNVSNTVDARTVTTLSIDWISESSKKKEPWCLWIEYADAAQGERVPSPFPELYPNDKYSAAIAYIDANIGVLLGKLKDAGLQKNTLIVLTSGNGNPLGEHSEKMRIYSTYLSTVHVPLIFVMPEKIPSEKENNEVVSSIDIMPTILGMLNISAPKHIEGRDLSRSVLGSKEIEPKPVYCENVYLQRWFGWRPVYSVIDGKYQFIDIEPAELYDIEADPKQEKNIAESSPDKIKALKNELEDILRNAEKIKLPELDKLTAVEKEAMDNLKKLAFISSTDSKSSTENIKKDEIIEIAEKTRSFRAQSQDAETNSEETLRAILQKYPMTAYVAYILGNVMFQKGSQEEAEKLFTMALENGSRSIRAAAMVRLTKIMTTQNKFVEAEKLINSAIQLFPNNPGLYFNLGNIYFAQKVVIDSENAYRKALEIEPRFYKANFGLASIYISEPQRTAAAVDELETVIKANPNFLPAHLMLAKLSMDLFKNNQKAVFHLQTVFQNAKPDSNIYKDAKSLLEELGLSTSESALKCVRP